MNDKIKCICHKLLDINTFKKHFKKCQSFLHVFNPFDYKITVLLREYLTNEDNLYLIRFLFKQYIKFIDIKIKEKILENTLNDNDNKNLAIISNSKNKKRFTNIIEKNNSFKIEESKNNDNEHNLFYRQFKNNINNNKLKICNNGYFTYLENKNNNLDKNYEKLNISNNENNELNKNKNNDFIKCFSFPRLSIDLNNYYNNGDNNNELDNNRNSINVNNGNKKSNKKNQKYIKKSIIERSKNYESIRESLKILNENDF